MNHVRAPDAYALLELVGQCHELSNAGTPPLAHAVAGIARVVGAPVAIWASAAFSVGRPAEVSDVLDVGWTSDIDRERIWSYYATRPVEQDALTKHALSLPSGVTTIARRDVLPDSAWRETELYLDCYRPAGVGDSLLSIDLEKERARCRLVILKRGRNDRAFGARERALLHLFHTTSAWALTRPRSRDGAEKLSPRERETLGLLMTSATEKELAVALGVRVHTAHHYIKAIYRKLGVNSRLELLARGACRQA